MLGKVGSGKSSLLSAILAEMHRESGDISLCPSALQTGVGFAGQEAWLQHATVRDNILFGKPLNRDLYDAVVHACALTEDLKVIPDTLVDFHSHFSDEQCLRQNLRIWDVIRFLPQVLPAGDQTEVGENGVTLSGGQKARIALARSVYQVRREAACSCHTGVKGRPRKNDKMLVCFQEKDVYFLDDPLAAVDAHVAAHMYTYCIRGLLREKTVVLCTHHTKYLKDTDLVIVMDHGQIAQSGTRRKMRSTLLSVGRVLFWHAMLLLTCKHEKENNFQFSSTGPPVKVLHKVDMESVLDGSESRKEGKSEDEDPSEEGGGLVQDEEKDTGVVKLDVYRSYWYAVGACLSPLVLFSLFLMQGTCVNPKMISTGIIKFPSPGLIK